MIKTPDYFENLDGQLQEAGLLELSDFKKAYDELAEEDLLDCFPGPPKD